jgi:FixJ family two-component response regulator
VRPLIAIVDDDVGMRRALSRLVRAHGLNVATFASGEALLDALPKAALACVLLDLQLPGIDGLEVLRRLTFVGSRIPAIVMTGFDRVGLREQCLAAGAVEFLMKPTGDAEVARALTEALRKGRTEP